MRTVMLWVLCFLAAGCSRYLYKQYSFHELRQARKTVSAQDGISEDEAIIIAINMILDKSLSRRLHSLEPFKIEKKIFMEKDGKTVELAGEPSPDFVPEVKRFWFVYFRDKQESWFSGLYPVIPFYVQVDADTGEVLRWGLKK